MTESYTEYSRRYAMYCQSLLAEASELKSECRCFIKMGELTTCPHTNCNSEQIVRIRSMIANHEYRMASKISEWDNLEDCHIWHIAVTDELETYVLEEYAVVDYLDTSRLVEFWHVPSEKRLSATETVKVWHDIRVRPWWRGILVRGTGKGVRDERHELKP